MTNENRLQYYAVFASKLYKPIMHTMTQGTEQRSLERIAFPFILLAKASDDEDETEETPEEENEETDEEDEGGSDESFEFSDTTSEDNTFTNENEWEGNDEAKTNTELEGLL